MNRTVNRTRARAASPAPPAPPLQPGAVPAPGYEVLAHLDRTGWLDLYDAWSEERECRCVVKMVRPDRRDEGRLRDRLLREGRWLAAFTHPHLVRAYETVESPEPLVVLETLSGETLAYLIDQSTRHRLPAADLAVLGLHLCSALHYLHGQGLLHLDVKPSNVVVDCRRAKVLDLSVARPPGLAPPGVGTLCYLAPEQARGGRLSAAADVWGIGITLYEAATGDLPFASGETCGETYGTTYGADATYGGTHGGTGDGVAREAAVRSGGRDDWYPQLEGRAPPVGAVRRLPRELAAAIDRCLEPDPAARPTIGGLTTALDTLLPQHRRQVAPPPPG